MQRKRKDHCSAFHHWETSAFLLSCKEAQDREHIYIMQYCTFILFHLSGCFASNTCGQVSVMLISKLVKDQQLLFLCCLCCLFSMLQVCACGFWFPFESVVCPSCTYWHTLARLHNGLAVHPWALVKSKVALSVDGSFLQGKCIQMYLQSVAWLIRPMQNFSFWSFWRINQW